MSPKPEDEDACLLSYNSGGKKITLVVNEVFVEDADKQKSMSMNGQLIDKITEKLVEAERE